MNIEREKQILEVLLKEKRVTVRQLAKRLFISEPSVRRDLARLEKQNLIKRVHGGAVLEVRYLRTPGDGCPYGHITSNVGTPLLGCPFLSCGISLYRTFSLTQSRSYSLQGWLQVCSAQVTRRYTALTSASSFSFASPESSV